MDEVTCQNNLNCLNSCKNKEYILIRHTFDQTSTMFQFSNVQLEHKNSWTCLMTDCYLHQQSYYLSFLVS